MNTVQSQCSFEVKYIAEMTTKKVRATIICLKSSVIIVVIINFTDTKPGP